jgi:hypothetical protein
MERGREDVAAVAPRLILVTPSVGFEHPTREGGQASLHDRKWAGIIGGGYGG